ncbi:MAG: ankyrin repeat domain-containing protein [Actinomycetota bacterium]|nr:ankyrin repeat domain-containing protein [Actinomycetota bacterium]
MPPRGLPGNANLEQLKKGAKSFQRTVRAGDPGAAEVVREFHPRLGQASAGSPELTAFTRADAQLVVARSFNFPSWPKLKAYLELVQEYARSPHDQPTGESIADEQAQAGELALADEFLRLACLSYGGDDPARWAKARELLEANPQLARANIYTLAATGDVAATRELLGRDPAQARAEGGPHQWEPLLYLTYSRLGGTSPERSALEVARLLLEHGADPNAGYLWEGLSPPFTVLTGAFGSGEGDSPAHPDGMALARLLLEHGADANDEQTLYNCQWLPDDAWLELLFEFGLGTGNGGRWHRLLAPTHATPAQMLEDQLMAAAHHGFASRVRLLLAHGVDPEIRARHPIYEARTPAQEAALWGYPEIVELLRDAGARSRLDEVDTFLAASMTGDRARTADLLAADPSLRERAIARSPDQLVHAAERNSLDAVALLIDLGFDVNARNRTAPLHEAAMRGNIEIIRLLIEHGADPNARDRSYNATPRGWAEHHGQTDAERCLAALES